MTLRAGSLGRFWLWGGVGAIAMFGVFSFGAGAIVWALDVAFIGLLAARSVTWGRAALVIAAGLAATVLLVVTQSAWPLAFGVPAVLGIALVRTRRDAIVLTAALAVSAAIILGVRQAAPLVVLGLAPLLLILAVFAVGRPQREAAGALTGAGLALFAFGAVAPGISLTLAGAILMLTLGLRRRRLAALGT